MILRDACHLEAVRAGVMRSKLSLRSGLRGLSIVVALCGDASRAGAGPLADAIERKDITGLRSQLPDPAATCALSVVYARRGDLARAGLFFEVCDPAKLPDDVTAEVSRAL